MSALLFACLDPPSCAGNMDTTEGDYISVRIYLIIGGSIFLILSCWITHFTLFKGNRCKKYLFRKYGKISIQLIGGAIGAINVAWGIYGFSVVYPDQSEECKEKHQAKMVLWWGILKLLFGFAEIFLAINLQEVEMPYDAVPQEEDS